MQAQYVNGPDSSNKSKDTAAIMAFFLVGSGIRNFYLGKTGGGVAQLPIHHFRSLHWPFHLFDLGQR
ncbi:NINE protein [Bifidobacterium sp. H6bp9]|uniref:NINE protein n=1 Tax=Bifidobacterium sp. H6bp9 TaxID=3051961 RepID=UPI0037BF5430